MYNVYIARAFLTNIIRNIKDGVFVSQKCKISTIFSQIRYKENKLNLAKIGKNEPYFRFWLKNLGVLKCITGLN